MHGLALLVLMFAEHDATHWEMSCDEWNQARIEILSDENHIQDAKEYLIDYFYTKVPEENCQPWQICLLYTSPSPRDLSTSRMPSSA